MFFAIASNAFRAQYFEKVFCLQKREGGLSFLCFHILREKRFMEKFLSSLLGINKMYH